MRNIITSKDVLHYIREESRHSEILKELLEAQERGLDIALVPINIDKSVKKSKYLRCNEYYNFKLLLTKY